MQNFLVIQLARFGDIIQSKRLILSLLEQGNVTLLIDNSLEAIAKIVYPTVSIIGLPILKANQQTIFNECKKIFAYLKTQNFDEVYPLNHSPLCQSICTLFSPEILKGYTRFQGYNRQSLWVKLAFRWLQNRQKTPLNLVDFWGLMTSNPISAHKVNPKAQGNGYGLGVVLSGQNARRSLSAENYAKIINIVFERLQKQNTLKEKTIFLLGTNKEERFAQELLFYLPTSLHSYIKNTAGKTNFSDLKEILEQLELLLSPDTGTCHFAAHLGTPVEGFYLSSANMFETGPYGMGHKIWQASLSCSPCKEFEKCTNQKQNTTSCALAFQHQHFLYHLLHDELDRENLQKKVLENIIPYTSMFYLTNENFSFSQTWESPLPNLFDKQRQNEKNTLETYCASYLLPNLTQYKVETNLFTETDWILPQQKP